MRWHVHGTDLLTGQAVELTVDDPTPQGAIKSALDRQIVVSYVTPADRPPRRWRKPAAVALFIAVIAVALGLGVQNWSIRGTLRQAIAEQKQMSSSVAQAEHLAADIRAHGNLAQDAQIQVSKLADELAAARRNVSLTQAQLSAAHNELSTLEKDAARVPSLEQQITSLQAQLANAQNLLAQTRRMAEQLRGDLVLETRRLEQVEKAATDITAAGGAAAARVAALDQANRALASEIDTLKNELLVLAAQSASPAPAPDAAPAPTRWALRVPYETARSFLALHTDATTIRSVTTPEGFVASTGLLPDNAVQLRLVHDRDKERVYSATLTVSLAADAPKERLAENRQTITAFLQAFAPALKDTAALMTQATSQLTTADDSRRLVFLTPDCKVTVWNTRAAGGGAFTFRVESIHGELE